MRNNGQLAFGLILVFAGGMFLIGTLLHINIWGFIWPALLILLGVVILLRPRFIGPDITGGVWLLADIHRHGEWQVADEETWIGVGDVDLDLTQAVIPAGETKLRLVGFVGDVSVRVPQSVGLTVNASGFVTDAKVLGHKQDLFLSPLHFATDDYAAAERKIRLDTTFFVHDLKVRQV